MRRVVLVAVAVVLVGATSCTASSEDDNGTAGRSEKIVAEFAVAGVRHDIRVTRRGGRWVLVVEPRERLERLHQSWPVAPLPAQDMHARFFVAADEWVAVGTVPSDVDAVVAPELNGPYEARFPKWEEPDTRLFVVEADGVIDGGQLSAKSSDGDVISSLPVPKKFTHPPGLPSTSEGGPFKSARPGEGTYEFAVTEIYWPYTAMFLFYRSIAFDRLLSHCAEHEHHGPDECALEYRRAGLKYKYRWTGPAPEEPPQLDCRFTARDQTGKPVGTGWWQSFLGDTSGKWSRVIPDATPMRVRGRPVGVDVQCEGA
jgi:hypothetical protein